MRTPLCQSPEQALAGLKKFQAELQALQTKYFFTEMHSADEDFKTGVMQPLYEAEKASMALLDRLVLVTTESRGVQC